MDDGADRPAVGHAALDSLRHQFAHIACRFLEVAVRRAVAFGHGAERTHAAVRLVGAPLIEFRLARRLLRAGEQRTHHHRGRAGADRLGDIAGITHAAIRHHRHVPRLGGLGGFGDRRDLRHADAGDHPGGANAARADAHLHRVHARLHERLGAVAGAHVAAHHGHVRVLLLYPTNAIQHALGMAVRRVNDQNVHAGFHQGVHAVVRLVPGAHAGANAQLPKGVLAGIGKRLRLGDVLHRHHAFQGETPVHQQHLLYAVRVQELGNRLQRGVLRGGDEALLGRHHLRHRGVQALLETDVAAGDDADQFVAARHRHAGNAVLRR